MFLSAEQLLELTGYIQPAAQIRWLQKNGVRHFVRADGHPVVQPSALEPQIAGRRAEPKFEAIGRRH